MIVPKKTLADLEWQRLLGYLAERCTGEEAASICRNLPFLPPDEVAQRLELIKELASCIAAGDPPLRLPFQPVGQWSVHIRGQGSAPSEALIGIASNLRLFLEIHRYLSNRKDTCPNNAALVCTDEIGASLPGLTRLASEIEGSFEPDGTISDGASAELHHLRKRVTALRNRLIHKIEKIAAAEVDLLQEQNFTIRNDRYVLPVRADAHRKVFGIVHGASGSKATVFVEPEAIIEDCNELTLAKDAVRFEEAKILKELSEAVRDKLPVIETALKLGIEADTRIAAAKLSIDMNATAPKLAKSGHLNLMGARHPLLLLDGVKVVPCNVFCEPGRAVIISGPNAGGKTVVLKTVGLISLMLSAGLPIPVFPDSSIGIPATVLTDIGDEQSLVKNLSTFSAHMTNLSSIVTAAGPGAVVLLDELASGTDPSEGAALAEAFLEKLTSIGATTFATTHFEKLKVTAEENERFSNAAVGFDLTTMLPTFELRLGSPGSSSALAIARRFGAPCDVIARAKEILPEGLRGLASAVEALEKQQKEAALEKSAFADARREAEETKHQYQKEIRCLKEKQSKLLDKEMEELWRQIKHAREKVRDAEISIRRSADHSAVVKARRTVNEIAEKMDKSKLSLKEDSPGRPALKEDIVKGKKVHVPAFGATGVVESDLKGGKVFVSIGNVKTKVSLEDIRIIDVPRAISKKEHRSFLTVVEEQRTQAVKTTENTVDLRGMTVDEAIDSTDRFLDRALKNGLPAVFVLHGHGTGALKDAVRAYLSESVYVEAHKPGEREEGGDGITVVWLR